MRKVPELIVMLTYNDRTIENAFEVFEECKDSSACLWGMKEAGIPLDEMKYIPFVGRITGRPSVLEGTIDGLILEANWDNHSEVMFDHSQIPVDQIR